MKIPSNFPILTWAARQWLLISIFVVTAWMCTTERRFSFLGKWDWDENLGGYWRAGTPLEFFTVLLWALPLGLVAYLMTLLSIHLHYRETIDKDVNDGTYRRDWEACTSTERVKFATWVRIGIFIGFCILLSGLARV